MLRKISTALAVLQETWRLHRASPDPAIFQNLGAIADRKGASPKGFSQYLRDYPARGDIRIDRDWFHDKSSGEMRLHYTNSLFAPGCIRLIQGRTSRAVILFLPGNLTGSQEVLGSRSKPQNMTGVATATGMGLACWDWPLQGVRRDQCLYQGLKSLFSAEREYSRILPFLGTSLWREYVAELQFALTQIGRFAGTGGGLHVVGWSMGAQFAYLAPLLDPAVSTVIAAGSCARVRDLLKEGKSRVHGFFFYPMNGLDYFDLDDIAVETLKSHRVLAIMYGERDSGCLESTSKLISDRATSLGLSPEFIVLPGQGHEFSPDMKRHIMRILAERQ